MSDSMLQIIRQEAIEKRYNRKHIDQYIRDSILGNPDMVAKIDQGVQLIEGYKAKNYYDSKNLRIAQLDGLDMAALVLDIFVGIAYCQREELFTSVTAQLASRLQFSDKSDAIKTVAELVAVLCETDAFDINKASSNASLMIQSQIPLEDKLVEYINNSQYLPPMVCKPLELTSNYSSGYLSHTDSVILGSGNHHDGDVCLDVLNTMNAVELKLATDFLSTVEEEPTFDLDTPEKVDQWANFKKQSYAFYLLMVTNGNVFHLCHRYDKRGRIYSSGFHINTQGTAFKKAALELANEEHVQGVP